MKIISQIFDKIKIFFRHLSKILPLFIGIAALYVAIEGRNDANRQFQINSKTSDSLFNTQLKHSKALNDSLISQISILQDITNKQLQITDEQLKISIELFQDQIYSGRPKLYVLSNKIADSTITIDNIFQPRIVTVFKNNGKRSANKISIRSFTLFNNFLALKANLKTEESYIIEPEGARKFQAMPVINQKFKDDFYYCYDIIYYDKILKQEFIQPYYYHYYKSGDKFDFYFCKIDSKEKIKESINHWLRTLNKRLFDQ